MEIFVVNIDLSIETIVKGYKHYFGTTKNPTKKDLADWIGSLAEADILDSFSHKEEEDEEDEDEQ